MTGRAISPIAALDVQRIRLDGAPMLAALEALGALVRELGGEEALPAHVRELMLDGRQLAAGLFQVVHERGAAGRAGETLTRFEPTERLDELMAALRALERVRPIVDESIHE